MSNETASAAEAVLKLIGGAALFFIVVPVGIIWDGYVLSILWGWFAVPLFSLPPLTLANGIAVSVVIGFLTHQYFPTPEGKTLERALYMFFSPAMCLLVGWIVSHWTA